MTYAELKIAARRTIEALDSASDEEKRARSEAQRQKAFADHERFVAAFQLGQCFECGQAIASFDKDQLPCIHWLMRPVGSTKAHIRAVLHRYGLFQVQIYLRWVANQSSAGININDLSEKGDITKIVKLTIRYGELEWSFSCSHTDYNGHQSVSVKSQQPHYHFQMRVKKQAFIKYKDEHVPLQPEDVMIIERMLANPNFRLAFAGGLGMDDLLREENLEALVKGGMSAAENSVDAHLQVQTILMADEGTMLSGDMLADLAKEAQAKGVTMASLIDRIPNAKATMFVSAGPAVVDQAVRTGGRRKRCKPD